MMLRYKKYFNFFLLYLIIVYIFCFTIEKKDVTLRTLYFNIHLTCIIFLYYFFYSYNLLIHTDLRLYRFSRYKDFIRHLFIEFTKMNACITIVVYVIYLSITLFLNHESINKLSSYPIHWFIIFEVVFIFLLSRNHTTNDFLWMIFIYSVSFIMYLITVMNEYLVIKSWNIFIYFANSMNSFSQCLQHYMIWIVFAYIVYLWGNRRKEL